MVECVHRRHILWWMYCPSPHSSGLHREASFGRRPLRKVSLSQVCATRLELARLAGDSHRIIFGPQMLMRTLRSRCLEASEEDGEGAAALTTIGSMQAIVFQVALIMAVSSAPTSR